MNCLIMVLELIVYLTLNQHRHAPCYCRMRDLKRTVNQTPILLKRPVLALLTINVQLIVRLSIPAHPFKILFKSATAPRLMHMKVFLSEAQKIVKI